MLASWPRPTPNLGPIPHLGPIPALHLGPSPYLDISLLLMLLALNETIWEMLL